MTTSSNVHPSAPSTSEPLRLQLSASSGGGVDGAWWPWSRDLQQEAAALVDGFPTASGRISRLLFSRPDWDNSSHDGHGVRSIRAARGQVKVGSFPSDDTHLMILSVGSGRRLKLLVIPSDTPTDEAEQRLRAVAPPGSMRPDGAVDADRWDNEAPSL
jgi:hypothetical protein